ncbi:rhodanese-like/PpiC domain-containing protein 12, chloroplastic [Pyrus x bretschneideri]|uniref:rhodanese-like/PpiC domain-containing protein 12, chloroplastic n=1 Tax=Pyrus x bretschneideri TaxID=225117 RepID=UPI00202F24A4|nr:rhodanese-like/PpiC domain-containing protein 12, chloroplastic [Pyrus x bretschneideri]
MFRASCNLRPIATAPPALNALLTPNLHLSSPSNLPTVSTFAPLCHPTFLSHTSCKPASSRERRLPLRLMGTPFPPRSTASFSAESGSGTGREILVQHLLLKEDSLELLVDLQKRVSAGEDLSDLATEYSICPSKEEGGMLGWVRKGQMVPEFEEAAFSASLNKVVRCKTQFGWHLLQVLSEREESLLQDIKPEELHVKMQDPSFVDEAQLIDVREPDEVAQASLLGFQVLPLQQFGSWGPEITTKFDPQKDTYVMCHHGMRSLQVAKWLQTQGFKRVYNVSGGIHAYAQKADPTIPTY